MQGSIFPAWATGCDFFFLLSGLVTEMKRLYVFLIEKKKGSILYYLNCDTFICTILKRIGLQYVFKCLELGSLSQWI